MQEHLLDQLIHDTEGWIEEVEVVSAYVGESIEAVMNQWNLIKEVIINVRREKANQKDIIFNEFYKPIELKNAKGENLDDNMECEEDYEIGNNIENYGNENNDIQFSNGSYNNMNYSDTNYESEKSSGTNYSIENNYLEYYNSAISKNNPKIKKLNKKEKRREKKIIKLIQNLDRSNFSLHSGDNGEELYYDGDFEDALREAEIEINKK